MSLLNLLPHFSAICKKGIIRLAAGDARKVLRGAPEEGWLLEENLSARSHQVPDIFSVWYPQLEHLLFLCEFRQKAEGTEQRGSLPSLLPQRRHVKLSDEPLLFSTRKRCVPYFQIKEHIVGTPERLNTPTSLPQSLIGALSPFLRREQPLPQQN